MLLGKWHHDACKAAELTARQRAAGPVIEIPYEEPEETAPHVTGIKVLNRRNFRRLKRRS